MIELINRSLPYNEVNEYQISTITNRIMINVISNWFAYDLVKHFIPSVIKGTMQSMDNKTKRFYSLEYGMIYITKILDVT